MKKRTNTIIKKQKHIIVYIRKQVLKKCISNILLHTTKYFVIHTKPILYIVIINDLFFYVIRMYRVNDFKSKQTILIRNEAQKV